jgi:hypothetical protein
MATQLGAAAACPNVDAKVWGLNTAAAREALLGGTAASVYRLEL